MSHNDDMENFRKLFEPIRPIQNELPELEGIDLAYGHWPLHGTVGGDHLIFIDFHKREYDLEARLKEALSANETEKAKNLRKVMNRAGVLISDVSGHMQTDGTLNMGLHQAFLLGAKYEMDKYGEITGRLLDELNDRFYQSSFVSKYVTALYGEIDTEGVFRYISAGHHHPLIFGEKGMAEMQGQNSTPLGLIPTRNIDSKKTTTNMGFKEPYKTNQIQISSGEVLLLYTDGLIEHANKEEKQFKECLSDVVNTRLSAEDIVRDIYTSLRQYGHQADDITLVVAKKD